MSFISPFPGGGIATITGTDRVISSSGGSSFIFSFVNIGPPAANRFIALLVTSDNLSVCTVQGQTGARVAPFVYVAPYPVGTPASITCNTSSGVSAFAASVFSLTDIKSTTPVATSTSPGSLSIPGGGVAAANAAGSGSGPISWSGLSRDGDATSGSLYVSQGSLFLNAGGAVLVNLSGYSTLDSFVMAAWEPK